MAKTEYRLYIMSADTGEFIERKSAECLHKIFAMVDQKEKALFVLAEMYGGIWSIISISNPRCRCANCAPGTGKL